MLVFEDFNVLVTGGRNYKDRNRVFETLSLIHTIKPITRIINGKCHKGGADLFASQWAKTFNVILREYPADWDKYLKKAGMVRNREMLEKEKVDLVVAFPGGNGTAHMVSIAVLANIPLVRIGEKYFENP